MRISVVQYSPEYGKKEKNLRRLGPLLQLCVDRSSQLVVLPEMFFSGYLWPGTRALGNQFEAAGRGDAQGELAGWARRHQMFLAYGYPEKRGRQFYNSQILLGEEGQLLANYRKKHLFSADGYWAKASSREYRVVQTRWGRVGLGICMDLNFEDFMDFHIRQRTDILLFSTNWLDQGIDMLGYWANKIKKFSGIFASANRGGEEFGTGFYGRSAIFQDGRLLAALPGKEDGVLTVEI